MKIKGKGIERKMKVKYLLFTWHKINQCDNWIKFKITLTFILYAPLSLSSWGTNNLKTGNREFFVSAGFWILSARCRQCWRNLWTCRNLADLSALTSRCRKSVNSLNVRLDDQSILSEIYVVNTQQVIHIFFIKFYSLREIMKAIFWNTNKNFKTK